MRRAALLLSLLALAGCGRSDESVAGCLNGKGFLVEGDAKVVRGSSPGGVTFTLTLYASPDAARRAFSRHRRNAAPAGSAVVDFGANPPAVPGGPPARPSSAALAAIRSCVSAP